jgi:hypothetical protein
LASTRSIKAQGGELKKSVEVGVLGCKATKAAAHSFSTNVGRVTLWYPS